jgi:hypothetical protein
VAFFDDELTETITVKSQSSVDSDGDPSYGSASTMAARIQRGKDRDAEEIDHSMVLYTSTAIAVTDRVWLPEDDTSSADAARVPVSVSSSKDLDGGETLYKVLI